MTPIFFFHCTYARAVWFSATPALLTSMLPEEQDGVQDTLSVIINQHTTDGDLQRIFTILWFIWKARNDLRFQKRHWSVMQVHFAVEAEIKYLSLLKGDHLGNLFSNHIILSKAASISQPERFLSNPNSSSMLRACDNAEYSEIRISANNISYAGTTNLLGDHQNTPNAYPSSQAERNISSTEFSAMREAVASIHLSLQVSNTGVPTGIQYFTDVSAMPGNLPQQVGAFELRQANQTISGMLLPSEVEANICYAGTSNSTQSGVNTDLSVMRESMAPMPPLFQISNPNALSGTLCFTDAATSPDNQAQQQRIAGLGRVS